MDFNRITRKSTKERHTFSTEIEELQQSDKHKMQIQVGAKSYSLNIDKSLQKKLESVRSAEIQFKYTGGVLLQH